jgi:type II secretory pathway pseudopilin PulG
MKTKLLHPSPRPLAKLQAFTLAEVAVALAISVIVLAAIVLGFVQSSIEADWSSENLSAQALAMQGVEQSISATWDPQAPTPVDNIQPSNFPTITTNVLDIPYSGTNYVYATNTWTITMVATNPYPLKMIRVDTTWTYTRAGPNFTKHYTNTVATFRAPNQ